MDGGRPARSVCRQECRRSDALWTAGVPPAPCADRNVGGPATCGPPTFSSAPDRGSAIWFGNDHRRANDLVAVEVYHIESPDGAVGSRLRIGESEFWLSDEAPEHGNPSPQTLGGSTVRLTLTVADPDAAYARAVAAGATPVAPVAEEHGWRSGRLRDPYGHDWEIGRPLGG